jgi:uncharacterized protein (UPF0210 family)
MDNNKTTTVRIIPYNGKKAGEEVNRRTAGPCYPLCPYCNFLHREFILRGGRIPAPIHSFRN